jgi:ElaB/YqjD/DUF883 family membrane-anchored ribosome-binding protein
MAQAGQGVKDKGLAEQASEALGDAASKTQDKAVQLKEEGSERVRSEFDVRSTLAGEQLRSLAQALRRSGKELSQEHGSAAQLTEPVAQRVDRVGAYLERTTSDQLIHDVEVFARKRPWMLAGLGTLAGLALARFVKASSEQRFGSFPQGNRLASGEGSTVSSPEAPGVRRDTRGELGAGKLSGSAQGRTQERDQLTGRK